MFFPSNRTANDSSSERRAAGTGRVSVVLIENSNKNCPATVSLANVVVSSISRISEGITETDMHITQRHRLIVFFGLMFYYTFNLE